MSWASFRSTLPRPRLALAAALLLVVAAAWMHPAPAHAQGGTHTVRSGENLFRIALTYGTTVDALAAANGIVNPAQIYAGQVLIIPGPTGPAPAPSGAYSPAPAPAVPTAAGGVHIVQRGETLARIAALYGVSWPDLAATNGILSPNLIYAGQQLVIPAGGASASPAPDPAPEVVQPAPSAPTGAERTHTVRPGEGLATIARQYGLSWPTLAAANNISDPNRIYSGQVLIIPASDGQAAAYSPAPPPASGAAKEIVVDLSDQRVYAYENGQLVRTTLVSTGLYNTPTVQGNYRIYVKYPSQTMSGPGYYLPGVPYVMYFYQGYSLHGTYWHNNFGQPMSHGCVNLPTPEAEWFYNWAEIGTPVRVQY